MVFINIYTDGAWYRQELAVTGGVPCENVQSETDTNEMKSALQPLDSMEKCSYP